MTSSRTTCRPDIVEQFRRMAELEGRARRMTVRLGIDIGGTGIKGAPVDVELGDLVADRFRLVTPKKPSPTTW